MDAENTTLYVLATVVILQLLIGFIWLIVKLSEKNEEYW